MIRIFGVYLLVVSGLFAVGTARADERENAGACRADVQKLCKGIQPGGGRIVACLKQHESDLSPRCKSRMADAPEEGKELAQACKADAEALCKGVKPGQGRIMRCLADQTDKLSGACRAKISEAETRHPCAMDMERLCKGVQAGEGRIAQCMKKNEAQLSPECIVHIAKQSGSEKK